MIKWIKLDSGEYESEDKRFYIIKTYDRLYGNHWQMRDNSEKDYYKGKYIEYTLRDCKLKAEAILKSCVSS